MRTSIFSIFPFIAILTALSIPQNVSLLQLPNDQISAPNLDGPNDVLTDWPPLPYTVDSGNVAVTLRQYGQLAHQDLRTDIVHAIQIFRSHFFNIRGALQRGPIFLASSIVKFRVEFHNTASRPTGEDLWIALLPLQLYYSDSDRTLREIVSADIGLIDQPSSPFATFRITFHTI